MNDTDANIEFQSVPTDWVLKEFGQVASLKSGGGAPQGNEYFKDGKYPFVRVQHFDGTEKYIARWDLITEKAVKDYRLKLFKKDTILFPKSGASIMLEKRAKLPIDAYVVGHLCCVEPENVENDFLFYLLKYVKFAHTIDGSTLPYLNLNHLAKRMLPVPPLPEQHNIAYVLTTIQTAIEQQARMIKLTRELKSVLMKKLFTEGLRGEKQKETEIGLVPESWKIIELKNLLREPLRNGHSAKPSLNGKGIRTLTLTAVTKRDFSVKNTKLTTADPDRVSNFWLRNGDILIERANTPEYVGLAALYKGLDNFSIFPDLMIRVRVDEERTTPNFIAEYLITPVCRMYFQKSMHSTAGNFPKIDQPTVEKTLIPLPKLEEQTEIAQTLETLDKKIGLIDSQLNKLVELFRTLLHQLMTGQVRVKDLEI